MMERSISLGRLGCFFLGALSLTVVVGCSSDQSPMGNPSTGGSSGATGGAGGALPTTGSGGATVVDSGPPPGTGGAQGSGGSADAATDAPAEGGMVVDPGTDGDGDFPIASPFKADPAMSDQSGVAKGTMIRFNMANSTTFGDGGRAVGIYVPAGYVSGTEIPFMVAQDGIGAQNGGSFGLDDLRPLFDNLIAQKKIPMMAGIFVDPAGQRSVEYDTVSDKYYQFVETELLPAVITQAMGKNIMLNLTKDPEGRSTFGGSSGGAAAFTMAWFHPESYHRVLTISGTFVNLQKSTMYPDGAAGYYTTLIPNSPVKPIRVFLEAGSNDLGGGTWRMANDKTAAALKAKAYHYRYVPAAGAMHEDDGARRQYLPSAMEWLWAGYPIK
ncbi:MAG TPA: alpha/beta hydrolase-fold protein [Polyangia bacterium]|jgi:enterochelin esterase-like enzyme